MSRRGKIWIAIGIALFLAILIPVVHHCQLRFAVEKYIAELKAKGEPMDFAQVIPLPTPPEQNVTSANYYWQNPHAVDCVWPQPATPVEVQSFYEHPPK